MDDRLREKLSEWHKQIDTISETEKEFLTLESAEKPMFASLFLKAEGKTVVERECLAHSNPSWITLQDGLVDAKVRNNRAKRLLELAQASFNAEYLQYKMEGEAIQRSPRVDS